MIQGNDRRHRLEIESCEIPEFLQPLDVDLFTSRLSTWCPLCFSGRPDPFTLAIDTYLQEWTAIKCYVNLPWNMMGKVLA